MKKLVVITIWKVLAFIVVVQVLVCRDAAALGESERNACINALSAPSSSGETDDLLAKARFTTYQETWSDPSLAGLLGYVRDCSPTVESTGYFFNDAIALKSSTRWPVVVGSGGRQAFEPAPPWYQFVLTISRKNVDGDSEYYGGMLPAELLAPARTETVGVLAVPWKERIVVQPPDTISTIEKEVIGKLGYDREANRVYYISRSLVNNYALVSFSPGDRLSRQVYRLPMAHEESLVVEPGFPLLVEKGLVFARLRADAPQPIRTVDKDDWFLIADTTTTQTTHKQAADIAETSPLMADVLALGNWGFEYMDHYGRWYLVRGTEEWSLQSRLYLTRPPFALEARPVTDRALSLRSARFAPNPRYVLLVYSDLGQGVSKSWIVLHDLLVGSAKDR